MSPVQQIVAALAGTLLLAAVVLNSLLPAIPALVAFAVLAMPRSQESLPCRCQHGEGADWDPLCPHTF